MPPGKPCFSNAIPLYMTLETPARLGHNDDTPAAIAAE